MQRLRVALCLVLAAAFAACGNEQQDVSGPASLKYVPADAGAVLVIPTALQSLGNRGLLALLLVAPDAPLVPGALPLLQGGDITVHRLPDGDLYELKGLDQGDVRFTVPQVVFGLLDDRFVVASELSRARQAVAMDVSDVPDAHGAAVGRADFSTWDADPVGLDGVRLGKGVGELEADRDGIDARLRIEVPGGLD